MAKKESSLRIGKSRPQDATEVILKVRNLSVELGGEKIIRGLNFEVTRGEILVILGPNGAGKTVLFKSLLGILPYRGQIVWAKGAKVGYVPQRFALVKDFPLSVKEFFQLKNKKPADISISLRSVGLNEEILRKRIGVVSSGQLQRILVAWALLNNPNVLLFDEPTSGIDIGGEETIYTLLARLKAQRSMAVLLITHDLNMVYKKADRVLCLNKQMFCYGRPAKELTFKNLVQLFGEEIEIFSHRT
jgi:zinc transport system ATP-binding protein